MKTSRLFLAIVAAALGVVAGSPSAYAADAPARLQPWVKRGVVIAPGFAGPRSLSRISAPSVIKLKNGRLRMYFWATGKPAGSTRNHDYIFAAEASPANPFDWKLISTEPLLGPSPTGNLRDQGVSFPWVVARDDGPWLMYYCTWGSWAKPNEISNRTGLAMSDDQGLTWRIVKEPVLELGKPGSYDAGITGSVDVMQKAPGDFMMWYTAAERYQDIGDIHRGIVHIGMARSKNGIDWTKYPEPAMWARLERVTPFEAVVSKPSVIVLDGTYHMWFSIFGMDDVGYRLGYASSPDGVKWQRAYDKEIIPLTPGGFDSTNQSYPFVVDMGSQLWMFYTGNTFGATGIGLATLEKSQLAK